MGSQEESHEKIDGVTSSHPVNTGRDRKSGWKVGEQALNIYPTGLQPGRVEQSPEIWHLASKIQNLKQSLCFQ